MYLWHVHEGTCAATGAPVAGWTYRTQVGANGTLTSNASGNANTKGKSATFNADPTKRYSVNVHVATLTNGVAAGTIIACGDLTASKASGKSKPNKSHPAQAKGPQALDGRQRARAPAGGPASTEGGSGFRPALTPADRLHARRTREFPAGERGWAEIGAGLDSPSEEEPPYGLWVRRRLVTPTSRLPWP